MKRLNRSTALCCTLGMCVVLVSLATGCSFESGSGRVKAQSGGSDEPFDSIEDASRRGGTEATIIVEEEP